MCRPPQVSSAGSGGDSNASGKFSWRVHNFPLFREMIKTQKIMSPVFLVGECSLRLSVYQSSVSGVDYLSMWCVSPRSVRREVTGGPMKQWAQLIGGGRSRDGQKRALGAKPWCCVC